MALPTPETVIYTLVLPSNNKKVKYKPWNGKMEKSLQIALLDDDKATIKNTLQSVIDECTFNELDVESLPDVDTDWIIAQLRSKSVGEVVELTTKCTACEKPIDVGVDLSKAKVIDTVEKREHSIKIDNTISFKMRFPTKNDVFAYMNNDDATRDDLIASMIESVFTKDSVTNSRDVSHKEMVDYVESFNKLSLSAVHAYIDNLPKVVTETKLTCRHCKTEHTMRLEGVDFFID